MLKTLSLSIVVALAATLPSRAEEAACNAEPGCAAAACGCPAGCCCPRCGCHEGLCPVCHPYCEMKKVTKYKYCCKCEDKCIPHGFCEIPGFFCHNCGCDQQSGCTAGCTSGCESGNCGCGSEGCCHCKVFEVKKLVKIPYIEEVPVHKCWVEWVCPHCGCSCNGGCPGSEGGCAVPSPSSSDKAPTPPPAPPAAGKSAASEVPGGPLPAGANFAY